MMNFRSMACMVAVAGAGLASAAETAPLHRLLTSQAAPEAGLLALFAAGAAALFLARRPTS